MRIAVIFHGQIRTGVENAPHLKAFIGDLLPEIDFFCATSEHTTTPGSVDLTPTSIETFRRWFDEFPCKRAVIENQWATEHSYRVRLDFTPVLMGFSVGNSLRIAYEVEHGVQYDAVIKMRPDMRFGREINPCVKLAEHLAIFNENPQGFYFGPESFVGNTPMNPDFVDDFYWVSNGSVMNVLGALPWRFDVGREYRRQPPHCDALGPSGDWSPFHSIAATLREHDIPYWAFPAETRNQTMHVLRDRRAWTRSDTPYSTLFMQDMGIEPIIQP